MIVILYMKVPSYGISYSGLPTRGNRMLRCRCVQTIEFFAASKVP